VRISDFLFLMDLKALKTVLGILGCMSDPSEPEAWRFLIFSSVNSHCKEPGYEVE
jgi:hypothetical protein